MVDSLLTVTQDYQRIAPNQQGRGLWENRKSLKEGMERRENCTPFFSVSRLPLVRYVKKNGG